MYKHKVKLKKDRSIIYTFSYINKEGKRVKLKRKEHPIIRTAKEADEWMASQDAQRKARLDHIARKEAWKTKYYDFTALTTRFLDYLKKLQTRSWNTHYTAFEKYGIEFFLGVKQIENVNNWHLFYREYKDWLEDVAKSRKGKQISYSYMNKALITLNHFITFMLEYNLIDIDSAKKISLFPSHRIGHKGLDSVIPEAEYNIILGKLRDINHAGADLFMLLYATGMRINEALSLPFTSIYTGRTSGMLEAELTEKKLQYVGYLILESQAELASIRNNVGHVDRVALKGRKVIDPKNSRIIPIFTKSIWNMLVVRYQTQQAQLTKEIYGTDPNDYLLFDGMTVSVFEKLMIKAYTGTGYKPKSPHDCRHSFCTLFVGQTRSPLLARTILGHKSAEFERYLHIYEQMTQVAKQGSQIIDFIS